MFAEYKAKIILSGALHYRADKEKSAPVSPVCYHCVWLVWPASQPRLETKDLGETERERERDSFSEPLNTSFTLYCYTIIHVSARI